MGTETVLAADLRPGVFVYDADHGDDVEVLTVAQRFGVVRVTVEDSAGHESTWYVPADLKLDVER